MEAKDIITATVASLALIVTCISLWRAIRADRRSSILEFEQQRQNVINLFLENKLAEEARVQRLTKLREQVPSASYVSESVDRSIGTFELTISDIESIQDRLEGIPPPSTLGSSAASFALKTLRGLANRYKTYAQTWDNDIAEYVQEVQTITDLETRLANSEGDEETKPLLEHLRTLRQRLDEKEVSLIEETEEILAEVIMAEYEDDDVETDKPENA